MLKRALTAVVVGVLAVIVFVMEKVDPGEYDEGDEEREWWPWVDEERESAE